MNWLFLKPTFNQQKAPADSIALGEVKASLRKSWDRARRLETWVLVPVLTLTGWAALDKPHTSGLYFFIKCGQRWDKVRSYSDLLGSILWALSSISSRLHPSFSENSSLSLSLPTGGALVSSSVLQQWLIVYLRDIWLDLAESGPITVSPTGTWLGGVGSMLACLWAQLRLWLGAGVVGGCPGGESQSRVRKREKQSRGNKQTYREKQREESSFGLLEPESL